MDVLHLKKSTKIGGFENLSKKESETLKNT